MLSTSGVLKQFMKVCMLAFNDGIFSKHCGLFVDINVMELLGTMHDSTNVQTQQISSEHPEQAQWYEEALHKYLKIHNM